MRSKLFTLLVSLLVGLILNRAVGIAFGDQPSVPRPSIVVPLKFNGRPIRVIVDPKSHKPRRVRWAVSQPFTKLQIEQLVEEQSSTSPPTNASEVLDRYLDEQLKSKQPALYDEIHNGVPNWESWNHPVDRRKPVDLVIYGSQGDMNSDTESWAGVDITVRPYGDKVVAILSPYYTEFKESKGSRGRDRQYVSLFGENRRIGKMVKVPADVKALEAKARLEFQEGEEQSADDDPNAAERAWAATLLLNLRLIELQRGIPLRFYVDDTVLSAKIED